jgi:murein DD-endopeptidase MepM/ murein hydrolase activator NlpD
MPFATHRFRSQRSVPAVLAVAFLGVAVLAAVFAIAPAGARADASLYQNPFSGDEPYVGRTDMGVDVCLSPGDPIRAVGDGVVAGIMRNWAGHQPYLWYELTGGANAGSYVYVAEQITNLARIGQTVHGGDVIARYARKGTCIETGWSTATGATLAQATTGYTEGQVTVAGVSFARFLISLGVQGTFDLIPARATRAKPTKKHRGHPRPRA